MVTMWRRVVALLAVVTCASCTSPSADEFQSDPHGHLIWAARAGDVATVRALAASGADLDSTTRTASTFVFPDLDHLSWTALQHAVQKGHVEVVRELLEWGASPDATASGTVNTPLYIAAFAPDPALARLLVDAGADVSLTRAGFVEDGEGGPLWRVIERVSGQGNTSLSRREALARMHALGLTDPRE